MTARVLVGPNEEASPTRSNREKILHAAMQVAIRDGVMAMTLDAVAQEAGVSKGGLLYHFREQGRADRGDAGPLPGRSCRASWRDGSPMTRIREAASSAPWSRRSSRDVVRGIREPRRAPELSRFMIAILTGVGQQPATARSRPARSRRCAGGCWPRGRTACDRSRSGRRSTAWCSGSISVSSRTTTRCIESILDELLTLAEGP